ncbi:MAG TPA: hypothetical protein VFF11_15960, partial [Candidatus Binatia bacterium]|nr:hypothetical protein [Candidatus Binatia bacterium]
MFALLGILLLVCGMGNRAASAASVSPVLARLHWLGLNQISADTNSAQFMKIWRLPETVALEAQTLDKLSRWLAGGTTNAASAKLRPLLDDFVSSEFYLEFHAATNSLQTDSGAQPSTFNYQLCLALHLPATRSQLWQTNLATALKDLTGNQPVSTTNGWSISQSHSREQIELSRAGEWTLIGAGQGIHELLPAFAASLVSNPLSAVPRHPSRSNDWLETEFDPSHFPKSLLQDAPPDLHSIFQSLLSTFNHCHLTVSGRDGNVLTQGTLSLAQPWTADLPSWRIPTNYIYQSVNGFTAIRGISSWLSGLSAWQETGLTPAPDQVFFWGQSGIPFQTYVAAPLPMASNQLHQLASRLVKKANPWLVTHGQGDFQWQANLPGVVWN